MIVMSAIKELGIDTHGCLVDITEQEGFVHVTIVKRKKTSIRDK